MAKVRRFPHLRRRPSRATLPWLALAAVAFAATLVVTAFLPAPIFAARRARPPPLGEEHVPPPHDPFDRPPPPDVRLELARNHSIDAAEPLVDDNAVDRLAVVPVDAQQLRVSLPPISLLVLFHNEYDTLNHTLHTWLKNDLLSHVAEVVFFLNGAESERPFLDRLPLLEQPPWAASTRIHPSPDNMKLGLAIRRMVQLASHQYVLLLEKDWALIEPPAQVAHQLSVGVSLLNSSTAHVVRYRHRTHPGAPLHARIMHENREQQMLDQQSNLFCYAHHWEPRPGTRYARYFSRCEGTRAEDDVWCAPAKYCQWTNNPALFQRAWFLRELGDPFASDYEMNERRDANSNMLDFEFYTNWNWTVWNDRDFVVALPRGLFEHNEVGEQNLMNTVWYAWNRLQTDAEEKGADLLLSEQRECAQRNKSLSSGATFAQRFPIDFVRLYHYGEAMRKSRSQALTELAAEQRRVLARLEQGHGSWRHAVTDLTNFYYSLSLYSFPEEPRDMSICFVSALFGTEGDDAALEEALRALVANLDALRGYRAVVFCEGDTRREVADRLRRLRGWSERDVRRILFVVEAVDDLIGRVLGARNLRRVQQLFGDERWQQVRRGRSRGALKSAKGVALAMCRPMLLDDCVRRAEGEGEGGGADGGLGEVSHFVWFDAERRCFEGEGALEAGVNDHALRAQLVRGCFLSGERAQSVGELEAALRGSGMRAGDVLREMQMASVTEGVFVSALRSFGGSRLCARLLRGYYEAVLTDLLRRRLLGGGGGGGGEAASVAAHNVPYLLRPVEARGCPPPPSRACDRRRAASPR